MTKYSHMLDVAFTVISEEEDGSDITPEQIHVAIAKRLVSLAEANEFDIGGAIGICDTYEIEEQDTTDWKQELRDFINDKSKKYDMPRDKHGYVNLMAQLAANNEIDKKRLDALIARTTEEIRKREEQDNG